MTILNSLYNKFFPKYDKDMIMASACLDEELLAGYLEGNLSKAQQDRVERHLADCELCLQDFVLSRKMMQEAVLDDLDPVPAKVTVSAIKQIQKQNQQPLVPLTQIFKQAARDLYDKVSDVLTPSSRGGWELATVRGSKITKFRSGVIIRKTFAQIPTEIEIDKTLKGNAHIKVRFPEHDHRTRGTRVTLQKGAREVASFLINKAGYVLFEDVPFGHYSLVFLRNGDMFGTYLFELKETNHGRR